MARPQQHFDWHELVDDHENEPVSDSRRRMRWILTLFAAALAAILARAVQLEITDGENFRELATIPVERTVILPAGRGRILARDGAVLAADRSATGLAIQYRYLETPPDAAWLRRTARSRLSRADRRKPKLQAAMEEAIRGEVAQLHQQLARLCKLSDAQWQARVGLIQDRVRALASRVNERRRERYQERLSDSASSAAEISVTGIVTGLFAPPESLAPSEVIVAEQTAYHRVVDEVSARVAAAVHDNPRAYPGVKIVEYTRREYPLGSVASNLLGHVGPGTKEISADSGQGSSPVGLMGVERGFESSLAGQPGCEIQVTDHRGKTLTSRPVRAPVAGSDIVLSIDSPLQLAAEQLLDRAVRKREERPGKHWNAPAGGAIVVMDVRSGEIRAAASAPRFDPNLFATGDVRIEAALHDPRRPLFDRVAKMAIPPGSVFKPLTALALLDAELTDAEQTFHCQGFWHDPDRLRCQIFRQHGVGHGEISLPDALAQSCNVYFFHHVASLGGAPLVDWAKRFGFGRPTGISPLDEVAGELPRAAELRRLDQTQALAIGQGAFTATPLQIVRMYAALANGGYLLVPKLTRETVDREDEAGSTAARAKPEESTRIAGLTPALLSAIHEGLRRTVEDPNGTAFNTVRLTSLAIAGKTGTAETGGDQQDHAWFAGYVPADSPRFAFVVVLEHAGSGATAAGSVAKSLVQRMQSLRYFGTSETASKPIPPGKG